MRKLPQKAQGKDRVLCPYIFRSENNDNTGRY